MVEPLQDLIARIRHCRLCENDFGHAPRPVLRASERASILLAGQAPGTRVHETGIPWNDASGKRLREWMGIDEVTFYDAAKVNIVPMGFCYPGKGKSGGDNPPHPQCAQTWHDQLFASLPDHKLILVIGQYAQTYHLKGRQYPTLTETVRNWRDYPSHIIPLPHPSPRNTYWLKRNPWFEAELLPVLKERVARALEK